MVRIVTCGKTNDIVRKKSVLIGVICGWTLTFSVYHWDSFFGGSKLCKWQNK